MKNKLVKSNTNKRVAGVIGGIAEYVGMKAVWLRIVFLIAMIASGFFPLIAIYVIMAVILPKSEQMLM
jgi:phage shock protein C